MDLVEEMEDYEFIDKMEVEEAEPPKAVEVASSAASSTSIFHDRVTHLQNLANEDDDDMDAEVTSPVVTREVRVDHSIQVGLAFPRKFPVIYEWWWTLRQTHSARKSLDMLWKRSDRVFLALLCTTRRATAWLHYLNDCNHAMRRHSLKC